MGGGYGFAPGHGVPGGSYSQQYNQYTDSHGNQHRELHEKKEKSGKGGMLAAGAGGLAVGAVGGAMVGHAMGMSQLFWLLLKILQCPSVALLLETCCHFLAFLG